MPFVKGERMEGICELPVRRTQASSCAVSDEHQIKLEYESAHFCSRFLVEERELRYLEEKAKVTLVTRDSWILARGPFEGCELVQEVFSDLEETRRGGPGVTARDYRMAVDVAAGGKGSRSELARIQLVGARGRKPVVPRSHHQLEYLNAMAANEVVFEQDPPEPERLIWRWQWLSIYY